MEADIITGNEALPRPDATYVEASCLHVQPETPRFHPLVPASGFILLTAMSWLYATASELYNQVLAYWTFIPREAPFFDLAAIPAWVRCWQEHGLEVYADTSWSACGLAPIIYLPLWLRMTFLPTDPAWTNWPGLILLAIFLLSLGLLPLSHRKTDRALTLFATFSSLPLFAMERGNVDLVIFLLAGSAGLCLLGTAFFRVLGYSLILAAGLLKFYPLVLLAMILRERLATAILPALTAAAIAGATAFALLDELRRLTPVPNGKPFHDMWGAKNLPTGFPAVLWDFLDAAGLPEPWIQMLSGPRPVSAAVAATLLAAVLILAHRTASRSDFRMCLAAIPERTHMFLTIGSMLVVGCFFAGQNIGYRGVFLLLPWPGILALYHAAATRIMRRIFAVTAGSMLCVLWQLTTRHLVADIFGGSFYPSVGSVTSNMTWLLQEIAWWWLIMVMMALLIRFVLDSAALQALHLVSSGPLTRRRAA